MKPIALAAVLMLLVLGGAVRAEPRNERPGVTAPEHVAMVFHRLARRSPDFEAWAQADLEYVRAPASDKMKILNEKTQALKDAYNLLAPQESIVAEMPVRLSKYSAATRGFFVENFKDETFFPLRAFGAAYAIVPERIADRQWLKITDDAQARAVDDAAIGHDRTLTMVLTLTPHYADGAVPATLDGETYWLMAAAVKSMTLFAPGAATPLWSSDAVGGAELEQRQKLLDLKQRAGQE